MKFRVRVLYERDASGRVQGSSYLRLLRPLTHPLATARMEVAFSPIYTGEAAELVIVDRFWHPTFDPAQAHRILDQVHRSGARLIYALDDDLTALSDPRAEAARILAENCDGLLVTTPRLAERMHRANRRSEVVTNALDERLVPIRPLHNTRPGSEIVLGYMGTATHDDDLLLLLPALEKLASSTARPLRLELIGGVARSETRQKLTALPMPVRFRHPPDPDYPHFMLWFVSELRWDIGLAPLVDNEFNRCKSDIKFLDYSALGVAAVFSRGAAYETSVEDDQTGLLATNSPDSWVESLSGLIEDAGSRQRIAANARRTLFDQRVLSRRLPDLIGALERFLDD